MGGERRGRVAVGGICGGEQGLSSAREAETGTWRGSGREGERRGQGQVGGTGSGATWWASLSCRRRWGSAGRGRAEPRRVGGGRTHGGAGFAGAGAEPCRSVVRLLRSCAARQHPGRGAPGEEGEETRRWPRGDSRGPPSSPLLSSWGAP